ncbi:MAG: recombinase RecA ['Candidatus Kapabacteria' thiocyanatum]|uniref:Protein RecA n=1 Tax=Candidatus Kapaibacterium thiocyanatum TaxID=1895771 RepID=A0A1M3L231_9BACT|nr:recombinase RecA ['Candidatus Kapabacteria' thiocyanatum]OJX59277.1 MAG: recombinase RecA ['Candidatus Kapabacteria' thiocyanatum]
MSTDTKAPKADTLVPDAKIKAAQLAIEQIEKQFGKGSIMRLNDDNPVQIDAISTGCLSLDAAIGIGGVPRGRIIEIYGPESSGKTTVCLQVIAEAQRGGGLAAFVDTEHALDIGYAQRLGVDLNNLLLSQPEFGEQALEIVETLVRSGAIDVIVVDSVAALTPRVEIEGDMGDAQMGSQARLMSQAMRKLNAAIGRSNTTVIFTNQLRSKIGVVYGNPETTTGGNALKYYASVRIDIRRKDVIKDGQDIVGNRVRAKVVKNKVAPPFREAEFDIMYNEGISKLGDIIDVAVENGIVTKSGSWFTYNEERVQGRDGLRKMLQENAELFNALETEVRGLLHLPNNARPSATNGKKKSE